MVTAMAGLTHLHLKCTYSSRGPQPALEMLASLPKLKELTLTGFVRNWELALSDAATLTKLTVDCGRVSTRPGLLAVPSGFSWVSARVGFALSVSSLQG